MCSRSARPTLIPGGEWRLRRRAVWWAGCALALIACSGPPSSGAIPRRPFASHPTAYTAGTIQPDNLSRAQLDQATADFFDAWKAKYFVRGCGQDRAYIFVGDSPGGGMDPQSITVSEGHGYGMIILALMAGHAPSAQADFDALFRYFKDHPATSSPNLMAWNQVRDCSNSVTSGGSGTATDGDLDVAYALLLADRQWGSDGAIHYLAEAKAVIAAASKIELNATNHSVLLGDFATPADPGFYFGTRPSDFMADHFRAFQDATGDPEWGRVIDELYSIVAAVRSGYSSNTGLMPDFVVDTNTAPKPAAPNYLETASDGEFGYNACRVPWRLGTDYLLFGEPRALEALRPINAWVQSATASNPAAVMDGYTLAGAVSARATGASTAFLGPLAVSAMAESRNQAWLNALWATLTATPLSAEGYYGNTVKLLSMIVVSGNWWRP